MDSLGHVCFVLFVGAMIFGVLGREAIGRSYQHQMEINNGTLPSHLQVTERLHFLDSLHSVYLILRVMFGDWIEPLTQCMRGIGGQTCTLIIFPALIFGRFLVLGVFLAIIITTFRREYRSTIEKKKDDAPSTCTRGLNWVKEAIYSCCTHPILSPPPGDESKIRRRFSRVIDNRFFGWSVLIIVFINCVVLCMENILLEEHPSLQAAVQVLNGIFCTFYIFELLCKLIGHGFHSYFSTGSTILEFVIAASLLLNVSQLVKEEWCVLRALVALRLASRWTAIKVVASILLSTIPSILYVTLVSSVFWAIFAIMGVQMFGGKFLHCVDYDFQRVHHSDVPNRTHCDVMNYTWVNSELNFDNVARGVVALLQVVTFQKWEEVTSIAVDVPHGINLQPVTDNNVHLYAFFFIVVLFGAFYPFSLFVGIIIENFNKLAEKHEGGILNVFLSERWRKYLSAIEKEDGKPMERPSSKLRAFCYDLSVNIRFELFMLVIILVNMICMMVQSYEGESPLFRGWPILSIVFTIVLTVEAIIKIIGMRRDYFKKAWNLFDFLVVIFAILDIILLETLHNSVRLGRELRLVRLLRFYRIPRVEKVLNGGKLLSVITKSFPAHLTLSALLFLVMFAYAAIGTLLFAHIKLTAVLNQVLNFETVGHSMVMLFRLFTSGFWYDVLVALRIEFPDCGYDDPTNTDCGPSCPATVVLFITSYIIINFMIITIYAAVVLHNFKEIYQQDDIVNNIDMFFVTWTKYDPTATQFISLWKVPNFLHNLEPPLRIAKPNGRDIASFNMPIAIGPVVHCMDILNALLNNVTRKDKESDVTNRVQELAEQSFKKYFPIRKHLELNTASQEWNKDDLAATLNQNVSNQQNIWIEADLSAA